MGSSSSTAKPGSDPSYWARAQQQAAAAGQYLQENVNRENAAAAAQKTANVANQVAYWSQGFANLASGAPSARPPTALQQAMTLEGTQGGCECPGYFGGGDDDPAQSLREYYESRSAKAKESVIRRLGRALNEAGLKITDPDTADLDEIVKQLVAQIPNPRSGRTFSSRAADHERVCKLVANALNAQFTPGAARPSDMFIDSSLGPEAVCRAVGEWVHSFASGVNTEFLDTLASIRNIMHNVRLMDEVMTSAFEQIRARVDAGECGQESLRDFEVMSDLYSRAQKERTKQEELLNNILHLQLGPLELELETAMRDESERNHLVQKIGIKPGTGEFADTLAMAISGLGTAASIAHRVNKALKTVGASVDDYLRASDETFLRDLDASLLDLKTDKNWAEVVSAMSTLRAAFSSRKDKRFAEALRSGSGEKTGGATVDARVKRQQAERAALVADFSRRLAAAYEEFVLSLKALTPELGASIPIGPEADSLRDSVARLARREERLELALIGYFGDAGAREKKEGFLQALKHISVACSALEASESHRAAVTKLARVRAAVEAAETVIDRFTDRTSKFFGGASEEAEFVGGADSDLLPHLAQSGASLAEAASEFIYFYYIAKVRENFARAAKELPSYGAKYEDLLGDAIAGKIQGLHKAKEDAIKYLDDPANHAGGAPLAEAFTHHGGDAWLKAAKEWVEKEFEVKMGFYRALEAVDLYLKAFTAGIVSDPGAVSDIRQQLQGVKVIARWYNENSGNAIWQAFECMRSVTPGADLFAPDLGNPLGSAAMADPDADRHYYAKLSAAKAAHQGQPPNILQVGLPFLGVWPGGANDMAGRAKKYVAEAYDNFQGLKNLFSAFMQIGVVFEGNDIRRQVFMSPTQLYKSFIDYLKHSALSINLGGAPRPLAPAVPWLPGLGVASIRRVPGPPRGGGAAYFGAEVGSVYFGSVASPVQGNFSEEDKYFAMAVKAIAGKVLTALGVFDMFDRRTPLIQRSPTRAVLGGGAEPPTAVVGATELYFRLPRLVEFYRCLRWEPAAGDPARISMLPELEGVFSGLIRIIFTRMVSPSTGDYTESELHDVVREVNHVWAHFHEKHGATAVDEAVSALVAEINRRLGIIKGEDMAKYWGLLKQAKRVDPWTAANNTDYSILPGEGEIEDNRRAPSDRYIHGIPGLLPKEIDRIGLDPTPDADTGRRKMLRAFMNAVEKDMRSVAPEQVGRMSFALMLKQAKVKMQAAATPSAKLEIAMELIQGAERVSTEQSKALMFSETVVLGLNALSAVEAYITLFENQLKDLLLDDKIAYLVNRLQSLAVGAGRIVVNKAILAEQPAIAVPTIEAATTNARYILPRDPTPGGEEGPNPYYGGRAGTPAGLRLQNVIEFIIAEADQLRNPANGGAYRLVYGGTRITAKDALVPGVYAGLTNAQKRYLGGLALSARLLVDTDLIMVDFIEALYSLHHSSGGLIEVKLTATGDVMLGFSRLRELAESLMADVKHYLEVFRPFMPAEDIRRYESSGARGSVYWLEENLFDRRFRGSADEPAARERTMDGISRKATEVLRQLKGNRQVAATDAPVAGNIGWAGINIADRPVVEFGGTGPAYLEDYGRALSQLVFYDAGLADSGVAHMMHTPGANGEVTQFALGNLVQTAQQTAGPNWVVTEEHANRVSRLFLYSTIEGAMLPHRSLMGAFNQLVAWYLTSLSEPSAAHRIYSGLVTGYANGPAARSVMHPAGNSFPDLSRSWFGQRGDPKADAILYQSLAYTLQRLVSDVDRRTQISEHLIPTLTDVPAYLKEGYRANLPSFVRLFDLLAQKGEFIKQFFQRTGISCKRPSQLVTSQIWRNLGGLPPEEGTIVVIRNVDGTPAGLPGYQNLNNVAEYYPAGALAALEPLSGEKTSEQMKTYLAELIDSISAGAYALSASASEVLKELGDQPVYFQAHEGSIEAYRMRQGKMPLMPLSLATMSLKDLETYGGVFVDDTMLFPKYHKGEAPFKFQYGVRGLLAGYRPVTYDQMPGVKSIIDGYNGLSASREQLDSARYLAFGQRVVDTLRYLTEGRNYKSAISTTLLVDRPAFNTASLFGAGSGLVANAPNANVTWALTPGVTMSEVTGVVETTNQETAIDKIVKTVLAAGAVAAAVGDRAQERVMNLIDLNIEPINPSAFMRDIPLANLYNYELAFERMATALYGENSLAYTDPSDPDYRLDKDHLGRIVNVRQMFLALLCDPYLELDGGAAAAQQAYEEATVAHVAPPAAPVNLDQSSYQAVQRYGSNVYDLGADGLMHRIFRGDNDLGLGRPKFLSDQLFNKALLGNLYPTPEDRDIGGPGVGAGISRGRAGVNDPWRAIRNAAQKVRESIIMVMNICEQMFILAVDAALTANYPGVHAPGTVVTYRAALDAYVAVIGNSSSIQVAAVFDVIRPPSQQSRQMLFATIRGLSESYITLNNNLHDLLRNQGALTRESLDVLREYANAITEITNRTTPVGGVLAAPDLGANPNNNWTPAEVYNISYQHLLATPMTDIRTVRPGTALLGILAYFLQINVGDGRANNNIRGTLSWFDRQLSLLARMSPEGLGGLADPSWAPTEWLHVRASRSLTYVGPTEQSASLVKKVNLFPVEAVCLEQAGRARFDTRFVRNLVFVTSALRLVRLKLNRELAHSRKVVVASHLSVAPGVTEFGVDPFNPNETYASRLPGQHGYPRFDDAEEFATL